MAQDQNEKPPTPAPTQDNTPPPPPPDRDNIRGGNPGRPERKV